MPRKTILSILDKKIFNIVKENEGITTARIVHEIRKTENIGETTIGRRVWSLIDCGELQLTDDCGIRVKDAK